MRRNGQRLAAVTLAILCFAVFPAGAPADQVMTWPSGDNNWNNSWTQIRCGSKNAASVASISTTFAATVTEITLTFDSADASKVNAFRLEINGVEAQTKTIAGGAITFVIADPAPNQTYTIVIDCAQGSSNGFVRLSQIEVQGYTA